MNGTGRNSTARRDGSRETEVWIKRAAKFLRAFRRCEGNDDLIAEHALREPSVSDERAKTSSRRCQFLAHGHLGLRAETDFFSTPESFMDLSLEQLDLNVLELHSHGGALMNLKRDHAVLERLRTVVDQLGHQFAVDFRGYVILIRDQNIRVPFAHRFDKRLKFSGVFARRKRFLLGGLLIAAGIVRGDEPARSKYAPATGDACFIVIAAIVLAVDIEVGLIATDFIRLFVNDFGAELQAGIPSLALLSPAVTETHLKIGELGRVRLGS